MIEPHNTFIVREDVLINNFEMYSRLANICYPMKTNSSPPVLTILKKQIENGDNYFSISNLKHFEKLSNLGVGHDKILLINTIATNDVIEELYNQNVRFFTFDNIETLKTFSNYADIKNCKLFFRLSINEVFNSHSHLGASVKEIKQMLEFIKGYDIKCGISFYIPKEINYKKNALKKMLRFIEKNFSGENLKFVSISGIKQATSINEEIIKSLKDNLKLEQVFLEPGEYMLYNAIDLKTSTIRFKNGKRNLLILKNGIFSGMLDTVLYNKRFDILLKTDSKLIPLYHNKRFNRQKIYLYGGSGDSADYLGKYYIDKDAITLLQDNLNIIIKNAGAYFEEFYIPHGDELQIVYKIEKSKGENYEI